MTAVLARRYALAGFAALWAVLAFAGLVLIYWISVIPIDLALVWSGDRTIVTLVVGAASLSALLAGIGLSRGAGRRNTLNEGFLSPGPREEARLPAAEAGLVAQQEPEHHVDARVLARHRVRLRMYAACCA